MEEISNDLQNISIHSPIITFQSQTPFDTNDPEYSASYLMNVPNLQMHALPVFGNKDWHISVSHEHQKSSKVQKELDEKYLKIKEEQMALNQGASISAEAMEIERLEQIIAIKTEPDASYWNQENEPILPDDPNNVKLEIDDWMIVDNE